MSELQSQLARPNLTAIVGRAVGSRQAVRIASLRRGASEVQPIGMACTRVTVQSCVRFLVQASLFDKSVLDPDRSVPPIRKRGALPDDVKPRSKNCTQHNRFTLHANTYIAPLDRKGLEKMIRYLCRSALATERLELLENDELVRLRLKTPWRDGTTGKPARRRRPGGDTREARRTGAAGSGSGRIPLPRPPRPLCGLRLQVFAAGELAGAETEAAEVQEGSGRRRGRVRAR